MLDSANVKRLILIILVTALSAPHAAFAQDVSVQEGAIAARLIQAVQAGNKAAVAGMIRYPLSRLDPLSPIQNQKEFIERYEDFFDAETIKELVARQKDVWSSWRGTAIGPGLIWIDEGKVIRINLQTGSQKKAAEAAKAILLHPTVRNYDRLLFACKTSGFQIRIHDDAGKVRYFSWKAGQPLSGKPDLSLVGDMRYEKNGGNATYTFKNGDFRYEIEDYTKICSAEGPCEGRLVVTQGAKILLDQVCMPDR
jgi:hypothetical protein